MDIKSYDDLLQESGLQSLADRKKTALINFAKKAANNPQFEHWFPLNNNRQSERKTKKIHRGTSQKRQTVL